ncbi:MerR family transcriptional regulator [Pseudolysinimonas yzui]|uniref:MerR family transcriptional regulator n=1 Tax=Pseudolysinimonas yzui TaxID=2708254 RepID=A0A8J3GSH2_9MICO|nr:MerR family transcriptional regulator [Pseudolysinimonas yzui]GHF23356.1 MerR family transcriptional regulator [Pseudolysinimonas yzui]
MTTTYSPAEAADRSGFSLDTLRYYEREGILAPVSRTAGGHRAYTEGDLDWLGLVRCLRDTGMPIAQLKRYSELAVDASTMDERLALLEDHAREVQASVDALLAQQHRLREKIAWYRRQGASSRPS